MIGIRPPRIPRRTDSIATAPQPTRPSRVATELHDGHTLGAFLGGAAQAIGMGQIARAVTGVLWVCWAGWLSNQQLSGSALIAMPIVAAAGMTVTGLAIVIRDEAGTRRLDRILVAASVVFVVVVPLLGSVGTPYATDELAYDQAAAGGLLHGVNPYTTDFTWTLNTFGVPTGTMTLAGTTVPSIAYPALSFLAYVPAVLALGVRSYSGTLIDLVAWAAAAWVMWRLLSPRLRPWVPLLFTLPPLLLSVLTGTTDALFVPFEIIAVCCWDRYGDPKEGTIARWIGPIALGLACCMKQQPWLLAPFLITGVAIEAHHRGQSWWRIAARYVCVAGAVFLLPNVPFMIWNPGAWLARVFLPVTGALAPMGIGPAGLIRPLMTGGGDLAFFSLAAILALAATFCLYIGNYARCRHLIPLLPLAALFVSTRSFDSYLVFCLPALVVNAASLRAQGAVLLGIRGRWIAVRVAAAATCAAALAVAIGLTVPGPLHISVLQSSVSGTTVNVTVAIENASSRPLKPGLFLGTGLYYSQSFTSVQGPAVVQPGARAMYQLTAAETAVTPHLGDTFQIQAGTTNPNAISTSAMSTVGGAPSAPR